MGQRNKSGSCLKQGLKTKLEQEVHVVERNSRGQIRECFKAGIIRHAKSYYCVAYYDGQDLTLTLGIRRSSLVIVTLAVQAEWWGQSLLGEGLRENGKRGIRKCKYSQLFQGLSL